MKVYLRMEAVNIQQFIGDCQDLSTIRGGGLLLLDSSKRVAKQFSSLSPISLGGSTALFEFESESDQGSEQMRGAVENFLNADRELCHATFVVDTTAATGNFREDRSLVLARNRWRQMQSSSLVVPHGLAQLPCRIDKVRPGDQRDKDLPISTSVKIRRDYGRAQKQAFYAHETGLQCPRFVQDLDELTTTEAFGNLRHKMAVIHLDGNGFGNIQNTVCDAPERLRQFDQTLRDLRKGMLRELLEQTFSAAEAKRWKTEQGAHRIETLLWGGDEIIWVVPAWTGLWVLSFFFERSKQWSFQNQPLTHSAGIVFCHHNAPIHRITDLAQRLTGYAKKAIDRKPKNVIGWQILESFDHVGQDLDAIIQERLPEGCTPASFLLLGEELGKAIEDAKCLKNQLPRNKVHSIARSFAAGNTARAIPLASETLQAIAKSARDRFHDFVQRAGNEPMAWVHLAELWDYFPE